MKASKVVIGIDESYEDTAITILCDKNIYKMQSIKGKGFNHVAYRENMKKHLVVLLNEIFLEIEYEETLIILERMRLKSKNQISFPYIKSTSALIATIIDACNVYDIPVYSVDTASWKTQIVGTKKPMKNKHCIMPEKYPTILYLKRKGLLKYIVEEYEGRGRKGVINVLERSTGAYKRCKINDNLADSYCIALYGFLPKEKQKLNKEFF